MFWAAVALLSSDYVQLYARAVELLSVCMSRVSLQDATVQSVLLASAPIDRGDANTDSSALLSLAMLTPRDPPGVGGLAAGAHHRSVSGDAALGVGGAGEGAVGPPVPWGVGQLLPWQDGGAGGAPERMLALQQLLWKGLLFPDARLPTVRLISQLAAHLSSVHVPSRGSSPALSAGGSPRGGGHTLRAAAAGTPPRPATPGGRLRGVAHSRTSSLRSSGGPGGGGLGDSREGAIGGGGGGYGGMAAGSSRGASSTPGSAAGYGLSQAPSPRGYSLQQQQQLPPLHEAPDACSSGDRGTPTGEPLRGALSRSAPELGGLVAGPPQQSAGQQQHGSAVGKQVQAAGAGSGGVGMGPGRQQRRALNERQQREVNFRTAPLPSRGKGRLGLPPAWPGGSGSAGVAAAAAQRGGGGGSAPRRVPGVRRVYQALIGDRHAQLAVTAFSLIPLACAQLQAAPPPPPTAAAAAAAVAAYSSLGAQAPDAAGELREALLTLAAACSSQGLQDLGAKLESLADARARDLPPLLPRLASQIARAFFPAYAEWALRAAGGALLLPGAGALHAQLLELVRCIFLSPGLELGPGVLGMLVGDSGLLSPVVALSQVGGGLRGGWGAGGWARRREAAWKLRGRGIVVGRRSVMAARRCLAETEHGIAHARAFQRGQFDGLSIFHGGSDVLGTLCSRAPASMLSLTTPNAPTPCSTASCSVVSRCCTFSA